MSITIYTVHYKTGLVYGYMVHSPILTAYNQLFAWKTGTMVLPSLVWLEMEFYLADCWLHQACQCGLRRRWKVGLWHCQCWVDESYRQTSIMTNSQQFC